MCGAKRRLRQVRQVPKTLRYLIVLLLVMGQSLCVGFGPPRLAARDFDDLSLWPQQVRQLANTAPPTTGATAALLLDVPTQTLLYAKNHQQRLPPASTAKMMTALVALERGTLSDRVVVQAADLKTRSFIDLRPGEVWTLEDLLYALLLPSDNVAALVIARHIAGSEEAFVELMNEQAARWGLRDTRFANPHGLDDPQHYSTALDLAQIALHGLADPAFAQIVSTPQRSVGRRQLTNLNQLLGAYEGAAGVKTGTTDQAGQCLVATATRRHGQVLSVVLGSADRYQDSRLLLDSYFANYVTLPLNLGPKGLNSIRRPDGSEAVLVLRDERWALLPLWQKPWLRTQRVCPVVGPEDSRSLAGTARFTVGRVVLAEMPLYALAP
jgi:D-alanyl-D-alanine carboxypeptidase (penicillin-binding protein 5/6)